MSYEDWFLRKLSDETRQACLSHAAVAEVCAPVQGKLWPQARCMMQCASISSQRRRKDDGKSAGQM